MSRNLSPSMSVSSAEVEKAKELCFAICKTGGFLDPENGCCSICAAMDDCGGWVPLLSDARATSPTA